MTKERLDGGAKTRKWLWSARERASHELSKVFVVLNHWTANEETSSGWEVDFGRFFLSRTLYYKVVFYVPPLGNSIYSIPFVGFIYSYYNNKSGFFCVCTFWVFLNICNFTSTSAFCISSIVCCYISSHMMRSKGVKSTAAAEKRLVVGLRPLDKAAPCPERWLCVLCKK